MPWYMSLAYRDLLSRYLPSHGRTYVVAHGMIPCTMPSHIVTRPSLLWVTFGDMKNYNLFPHTLPILATYCWKWRLFFYSFRLSHCFWLCIVTILYQAPTQSSQFKAKPSCMEYVTALFASDNSLVALIRKRCQFNPAAILLHCTAG